MQGEQTVEVKLPVMVMVKGRSIAVDHIVGIDDYALESHRTLLLHTTFGSFMLHDDVALEMARFFKLRPPAGPVEAPKPKKGNKAA